MIVVDVEKGFYRERYGTAGMETALGMVTPLLAWG
jgi:hypothetical protein